MHVDVPNPGLGEYLDDLFCERCWHCREVCPCDPRPLPEPAPSAEVRTLQRAIRAERSQEPLDAPARPHTRGTADSRSAAPLGPRSPLFPGYYRTGGAA